MSIASVSASLTAQNTFTDWIHPFRDFDLSISGTWAGTLTLQRSDDGGSTVFDVQDYVANAEEIGEITKNTDYTYRIGFKTGNYTSGTAVVKVSS